MARRRANGEGSICRRADGRWVGALTVGLDANGRALRRAVYGRTQAEARRKLERLRSEFLLGEIPRASRETVDQYLERWLRDCKRSTVRPSTWFQYAGMMRNHVSPRIGGVRLQSLRPAHVQRLLSGMEGAGASPRHVPARVVQVADIPRTISGKIVELAVRDVIHGRPVKNLDALANPEALELFGDREELRT